MMRSVVTALGALVVATGLVVSGGATATGAPAPPGTAAAPSPGPKPPPGPRNSAVVVRINTYQLTIEQLLARYPIAIESTVLASRGIYLVRSTNPSATDPRSADQLATQLAATPGVLYAERNVEASLDSSGYHAWPDGRRQDIGSDEAAWSTQQAVTVLKLDAVHRTATGAGSVVAVLDTGVDQDHATLSGRLVAGYDYVGDDDDPSDVADRVDSDHDGVLDGAVGHGTFVAGTVALVAPQAKIMPLRVLDSDGVGNVFTIAQGIDDAVHAGAKVVNLSFGTSVDVRSKVLDDAMAAATRAGAMVVAAAGNDSDGKRRYFPAADAGVMSVAALGTTDNQLANFSNFGDWIDVAAPGEQVVGPVPGGGFARWSGTSMATPFVAGEAALLLGGGRLDARKAFDAIGTATTKLQGRRLRFGVIDPLRAVGVKP